MAENDNAQNASTTQPQQAADQAQQPQAQTAQNDQPAFQMQRCYLKDASLEMPHAPEILMVPQKEAPQVDIQFEVSQRTVAQDLVDVTVRGTITVKSGDQAIILVEGKQSGIFVVHGIPAEPLQHITNVLCPSIIYPYLRANLADLMTRANVPPVHLPEVNFELLYQQRLHQAQEEAAKKAAANESN